LAAFERLYLSLAEQKIGGQQSCPDTQKGEDEKPL
jgi:hypothetical protein